MTIVPYLVFQYLVLDTKNLVIFMVALTFPVTAECWY